MSWGSSGPGWEEPPKPPPGRDVFGRPLPDPDVENDTPTPEPEADPEPEQ